MSPLGPSPLRGARLFLQQRYTVTVFFTFLIPLVTAIAKAVAGENRLRQMTSNPWIPLQEGWGTRGARAAPALPGAVELEGAGWALALPLGPPAQFSRLAIPTQAPA